MLTCGRFTPTLCLPSSKDCRFLRLSCRAETLQTNVSGTQERKKKVVIVGSGWAGLGAAHHLCNQGFDVTVLESGNGFGGADDVGIQGFWHSFQNIFSLVDELGIKPFTHWTTSAQYSAEGLEVEFPIFQDLPQLPTPSGILFYPQFNRLPLLDRLTSLPLMAAVIDFDNTDTAWRKYDSITARELFKQFGCSERLYRDIIGPLVHIGLFAPGEQCSAAATLGVLYYLVLAHQKDFDMVWCRGKIKEKIFEPWMDSMRTKGCKFLNVNKTIDVIFNEETNSISEVVCSGETYEADAVILAIGISTLRELIQNRLNVVTQTCLARRFHMLDSCYRIFTGKWVLCGAALCTREDFLKVLNLSSIDVLTAKLRLDRKVNVPKTSNAASGFGDSFGWTFFDLNMLYDEHKDDPVTVLEADFYHANELLPLKDDVVVAKMSSYLSKYIKDFETATVLDAEIQRYPKSLTHFFPGSYKSMMRGSTSIPNLFMAGDWIVTRHGSWSQEKAYVTGLEAANRIIDSLGEGSFARIIPVEEDEPRIQALRSLNRGFNELREQVPFSDYFLH